MPKTTVKQLREQTPDGYNLAVIVDINHNLDDLSIFSGGMKVLKEANGIIGVLRGLDHPGRMPGALAAFADDRQTHRLLHLVFWKTGASLHDYTFKINR